jgi:hypothetical protein
MATMSNEFAVAIILLSLAGLIVLYWSMEDDI